MSGWSPPTIPREWLIAIGLAYLVALAYSILVVQQILLGLLPGLVIVSLYFLLRFLRAVEAIADGVQRISTQLERERGRERERMREQEQ